MHRSENGSYKIVNNYSLLPTISNRRGKLVCETKIQLASWIQILATLCLNICPISILSWLLQNNSINIFKVPQDFCKLVYVTKVQLASWIPTLATLCLLSILSSLLETNSIIIYKFR